MSPFTTSIHSFFGLPLGFSPSPSKTVQPFTQSQSSFLSTCPNHLSLFRFTSTPIAPTPILSLNITLVISSLRDTPHKNTLLDANKENLSQELQVSDPVLK